MDSRSPCWARRVPRELFAATFEERLEAALLRFPLVNEWAAADATRRAAVTDGARVAYAVAPIKIEVALRWAEYALEEDNGNAAVAIFHAVANGEQLSRDRMIPILEAHGVLLGSD